MIKKYIGIKEILAKPMTRLEYNDYRGWELPTNEDGADEGYLVEYLDGGKPNHPNHVGYISWSPKAVFERAYIAVGNVQDDIMKHFDHEQLPEDVQDVIRPLDQIAQIMASYSNCTEKTVGMRKLLEARDCFIRAMKS